MTARALSLPRMSRAEALTSRQRYAPRAVLDLLSGPLKLRLTDDGRGPSAPGYVCVCILWGKDQLDIRCSERLASQILRALEPELDVAALPPDLAAVLLEAALLPAITAWEQASGREVVISSMTQDTPPAPAGALNLRLEDGSTRWELTVAGVEPPSNGSSPTGAIVGGWPVAPFAMTRFPLPAVLRIGTTRLTIAVLASLRAGDAVLLQTASNGRAMLVIAETWTAAAQHGSDGWRLLEAPRPSQDLGTMEWTMQNADAAEGLPGEAPIADPDELPVLLTFDVGRLDIPLGELRRLGTGSVLELGRSTTELVRISANGRQIGQGELVEVEGAAAVRIVRLFDHG